MWQVGEEFDGTDLLAVGRPNGRGVGGRRKNVGKMGKLGKAEAKGKLRREGKFPRYSNLQQ